MSGLAIAFAIWGVLAGGSGVVMALARTGPEDAKSNLSRWAEWVGVGRIPSWLLARSVDQAAYRWGKVGLFFLASLGVGFICGLWWDSVAPRSFVITSTSQPATPDLTTWSLQAALHGDFPGTVTTSGTVPIIVDGQPISTEVVDFRDPHSGAEFMGAFIPRTPQTLEVAEKIITDYREIMDTFRKAFKGGVSIRAYGQYGQSSSENVVFTNRIFIYHEGDLSIHDLARLETLENKHGLIVVYRDVSYLAAHPLHVPLKQ
jgi:hypothetical protein